MFEFIKGTLVEAQVTQAIVDVQGIGYKIFIPFNTFNRLPRQGTEVLLYTFLVMKEMTSLLHGFLSRAERDLFATLLGITGIGPKTALALLGHLSIAELVDAVKKNDLKVLSHVPGIGRKTAERLVLEIRDKLATPWLSEEKSPFLEKARDATAALLHLGYSPLLAQQAVQKAVEELSGAPMELSALITAALKKICT